MSLKDTNATLFNMLTDLEEEKRASAKEDEKEDTNYLASTENTQMADEKTSHLTVVNPLENLLDTQTKATVVLGNTKTVLADEEVAQEEEDIQEAALKEDSVSEEHIISQDQNDQQNQEEGAVQETKSSQPIIDNQEVSSSSSSEAMRDNLEDSNVIPLQDNVEKSNVIPLQDKTQIEGVITNTVLQENKNEINLDLNTFAKSDENTLSKFMEHAEDSVSKSQPVAGDALIGNAMPLDSELISGLPSEDTPSDTSSEKSAELISNISPDSLEKSSFSEVHSNISATTPITPSVEAPSKEPVVTPKEDMSFSAGVILKNADQLKIAQERIHELESTIFNLRQENVEFSSEIETLKKRIEELSSSLDSTERRNRTKIESISDERSLLEESLFQKNKEHDTLKLKVEELKNRLAKDLKSVRVREIELENRLELVKQEKMTLLKSKDEIILNLKRKTDHLIMDIDGYRKKSQLAQIQISENEERVQRSVRALRLALGMLEGNDSQ